MKIAYRPDGSVQHRVVTLAGELIDNSGTMSGGGRSVRRGGMSNSAGPAVTAEELAAAVREAAAAEGTLAEARGRKAALSAELRDFERAWPKVGTRISKLEMEVASLLKQKEDVAARIAALSSQQQQKGGAGAGAGSSSSSSAAELARVAELQASLPGLEAESKAATSAALKIEGEVSALQKTILEAGGEKVRRAKARCDRAAEAAEEVQRLLTKAQANAKAAEKSECRPTPRKSHYATLSLWCGVF